jgi:C_GCAxxG_C_C family probable redox protein
MNKEQIADLFMRGQDCGQVVIDQYAESLGLSKDDANRLTAAFGGGTGIGETCGAVIAAMMVIGMKYGHNGPDDPEHRDVLMAKRAEFIGKWKERRGSCMCNDMFGDDISTPEGFGRILESGKLFTLCPEIVTDAFDILNEMGIDNR